MAGDQEILHGSVVGPDEGYDAPDTAKPCRGDGCRQQQCSYPMMLETVIDGYGQLVRFRAHWLEHQVPKDPPARHRHETVAPAMIRRCESFGLLMTDSA